MVSKYTTKIAEVFQEKNALLGSFGETLHSQPMKNFLGALATGAGLTLGGIGVAAGAGALSSWRANSQSHGAYEAMLSTHPKLRMEDQQKVEQYFRTLWNFAPDLARDPLMAGGVVTQAIRMDYTGAPPTELIKTVVEIQSKHRETQSKYMGSPLGAYFMGAAGGKMVGKDNNPFYSEV
jgi:hypothetical protein